MVSKESHGQRVLRTIRMDRRADELHKGLVVVKSQGGGPSSGKGGGRKMDIRIYDEDGMVKLDQVGREISTRRSLDVTPVTSYENEVPYFCYVSSFDFQCIARPIYWSFLRAFIRQNPGDIPSS